MGLKSEQVYNKIAARVGKVDRASHKVHHVYKFKITVGGSVVETWMLDLKEVKIYKGDAPAECTLIISDEVMFDIGSGKIDAKEALKADKFDVEGNVEIVSLLSPYISEL